MSRLSRRSIVGMKRTASLASDENGFVASYWYDADGERTVKSSGEGE